MFHLGVLSALTIYPAFIGMLVSSLKHQCLETGRQRSKKYTSINMAKEYPSEDVFPTNTGLILGIGNMTYFGSRSPPNSNHLAPIIPSQYFSV
jgi:hypothetical protein